MQPPRLLILSFYYAPDLSAGSFRSVALVRALHERCPDLRIRVLTTRPNRYRSFASEAPAHEGDDGLRIERIALPTHRSGMRDQARAFAHYAREVMRRVRGECFDGVYATSSRLMTAALGAWVAPRVGARLYLDLRDIFVDTMADVLAAPLATPVTSVLSAVERWTVRRAAQVNLVSEGFTPWFAQRYPGRSFRYFTNGVDKEFEGFAATLAGSEPSREAGTPVRILYAGNIGEGQGLERLVPGFARALHGRARLRIVGDGGRRAHLAAAVAAARLDNVELVGPMSREALRREYAAADVLLLHLNAYDAFTKVLPSKVFEYAATGKPILAGVAGHAGRFVAEQVPNAAVFAPCDVAGAVAALDRIALGTSPRTAFTERFNRARIMRAMADDVLATIGAPADGVRA